MKATEYSHRRIRHGNIAGIVVLLRMSKKRDCTPGHGGPHREAPMWPGGRKQEDGEPR